MNLLARAHYATMLRLEMLNLKIRHQAIPLAIKLPRCRDLPVSESQLGQRFAPGGKFKYFRVSFLWLPLLADWENRGLGEINDAQVGLDGNSGRWLHRSGCGLRDGSRMRRR